uniref:DUF8040 domain-containing protein n=1 Tax=Fagus sylvatica TaxID=28930 RepID=A0A2N9HXL4_FAGSY
MVFNGDLECLENTRMDRHSFHRLCDMLKTTGRLSATRNMNVEEMVAMFLHIVAHDVKNKGHPGAAGLRNKPFPHYDDLAHVFGKDRATGFSAEGPSDTAQTVDREEAEENEDLYDTNDSLASTQGPPVAASLASTQGPPIARSSDNPSGATESMKKLAETFKHEADGADRRMKVHEELIFAGGGLTDEEIVKVGGIITADCNKTDYFFTLGGHFKKLYVYSLLQKRL